MPQFTQWTLPDPSPNVLFNPMAVDKAIADNQSTLGNLDINRQTLAHRAGRNVTAGSDVWRIPSGRQRYDGHDGNEWNGCPRRRRIVSGRAGEDRSRRRLSNLLGRQASRPHQDGKGYGRGARKQRGVKSTRADAFRTSRRRHGKTSLHRPIRRLSASIPTPSSAPREVQANRWRRSFRSRADIRPQHADADAAAVNGDIRTAARKLVVRTLAEPGARSGSQGVAESNVPIPKRLGHHRR